MEGWECAWKGGSVRGWVGARVEGWERAWKGGSVRGGAGACVEGWEHAWRGVVVCKVVYSQSPIEQDEVEICV